MNSFYSSPQSIQQKKANRKIKLLQSNKEVNQSLFSPNPNKYHLHQLKINETDLKRYFNEKTGQSRFFLLRTMAGRHNSKFISSEMTESVCRFK